MRAFVVFVGCTLAAVVSSQVIIGVGSASEFYPNLTINTNERDVTGSFEPAGLHFAVDAKLDVTSEAGLGYGIQGYIQYFSVGPIAVRASDIGMSWIGSHTMDFVNEPLMDPTPVDVGVRLVKFNDLNANGLWEVGEEQTDLVSVSLISGSIANSGTINLNESRFESGPVDLAPNSSYFFGGSPTFNVFGDSTGPFDFTHQGLQSFDITFTPVPEPASCYIFAAGILLWTRRRRAKMIQRPSE